MSVFDGFWGTDKDLRIMAKAQKIADQGIPTALQFNGREYVLQPREQAVREVLHRIEVATILEAPDDPDGTR